MNIINKMKNIFNKLGILRQTPVHVDLKYDSDDVLKGLLKSIEEDRWEWAIGDMYKDIKTGAFLNLYRNSKISYIGSTLLPDEFTKKFIEQVDNKFKKFEEENIRRAKEQASIPSRQVTENYQMSNKSKIPVLVDFILLMCIWALAGHLYLCRAKLYKQELRLELLESQQICRLSNENEFYLCVQKQLSQHD